MVESNDMELLQAYARENSEQAFRKLVDRHINLVHSVAYRQTGCAHLAQDVTQAVFIVLAEKSSSIPSGTLLTGWLFRATRFAAANAQRAETRRLHWEQKAASMDPTSPSEEISDIEPQIAPLLNEAIGALPERDRTAVLLRFFEKRSHGEIARTLGTTEDAAKMRLSRAVEKLRLIFRQRGVVVPAAALLASLSAQSLQAAPHGLATTTATVAFLKQTTASTLPIVKSTLLLMAKTKSKSLLTAALAMLIFGSAVVLVSQVPSKAPAKPVAGARISAAATNAPASILVFRDQPSWGRQPDFEDALISLGLDFDVRPSKEMAGCDLSAVKVIVIPGAQWRTDYYRNYTASAARLDRFLTNGGTLLLELNGAEQAGIPLPRGVHMVRNGAKENAVVLPKHPVAASLHKELVKASFASHGYLTGVPSDALVLMTESTDGKPDPSRPTFAEYPYGSGRVLAACQCFHDRDGSGRGPMMEAALDYVADQKWFAAKPAH